MSRPVNPKEQFSKKLAGRCEWYWFAFLVIVAVLIAFRPEAALYLFLCGLVVSVVMETAVLAYTDNSKWEKGLWYTMQTAKIRAGRKDGGDGKARGDDADDESENAEDDADDESENAEDAEEDAENTEDEPEGEEAEEEGEMG